MRTGCVILSLAIVAVAAGYAATWRSGVAATEREATQLTGGDPVARSSWRGILQRFSIRCGETDS